jgi:hypothetical protein
VVGTLRFPGRSRGLPAKQARTICGMYWLDSAVDEDYEACPNIAHVACRCVRQEWGAWSVQNGPSPVNKLMRRRDDLRKDLLTASTIMRERMLAKKT